MRLLLVEDDPGLADVLRHGLTREAHAVDVYVRYLRDKLGRKTIHTVRGSGYRLDVS